MHNLENKKVIAALIIHKGNILIAQKAKNDSLCGKWEFPGGKVEIGETDQECLKRELYEELGINATIGTYFMSSFFEHNNTSYEMRTYWVSSFTGEFFLYEHSAIKWVTPKELSTFDMPDPDKPIVKALENCAL
ncbi:hypothetical protein A3F06_03900 [candidate division TM6 bacterium RIFCSPHIGHO2_12_FULL_36_22]|nr:MAG: hypothetical protein A3F06_03900 [candidate division TM6 bacterium RIFCSPHIGHO2_12_FULL_36_22]